MGRPPKSRELHAASGNAGKRKHNTDPKSIAPRPDPGAQVPEPPEHLHPIAKQLWREHAPELHRISLLTTIDRPMFEMFCQEYAHWRVYEEKAGSVTPDQAISLGFRKAADRAIEKAKSIAAQFGLEPRSRGAIKTIPLAEPQKAMEFMDPNTAGKSAEQLRNDFRVVSKRVS